MLLRYRVRLDLLIWEFSANWPRVQPFRYWIQRIHRAWIDSGVFVVMRLPCQEKTARSSRCLLRSRANLCKVAA